MRTLEVEVSQKLEKDIYWIYLNDGGFPRKKLQEGDKVSFQPMAIKEFAEAFIKCDRAIWILDGYFNEIHGLSALWEAFCFTSAQDIRVISCEKKPNQWLKDRIKETWEPQVEIQWREYSKNTFPIHDRFALLDNELWHFGSTVGGGYPGVGAATRGWDSEKFVKIFKNLWEK
ncbi:MAG: hypothetical protein JSU04_20200 [Bdellovibrionales bacterium]|nr:hypothetical protein [Bdellovibrionales bacterium]